MYKMNFGVPTGGHTGQTGECFADEKSGMPGLLSGGLTDLYPNVFPTEVQRFRLSLLTAK